MIENEPVEKESEDRGKSLWGRPLPLRFVILAIIVYAFAFNLYLLLKS